MLITEEIFLKLQHGEVFASGIEQNSIDGIFMVRSNAGRLLRWIAKKGYNQDFAIYVGWEDQTTADSVMRHGDKVTNTEIIKRLLNCDDEVLKRMRR